MKTLKLYVCFLGFTDQERPRAQVERAMDCARLSALYDYETDWHPVSRFDRSLFLRALECLAPKPARELAHDLFKKDTAQQFSHDGLERGAAALAFYHAMIQSRWLEAYSADELVLFGRELQRVDDALDLEEDRLLGKKNCFLNLAWREHERALHVFLKSSFFTELSNRALIYGWLKKECAQKFRLTFTRPTARALTGTTRPLTGLFAFILTLIGFEEFPRLSLPALLSGTVFAGVTWSIMVWNDLADRVRDVKKGKSTAYRHPWDVFVFWSKISALTLAVFVGAAWVSPGAMLVIAAVWAGGFWYSHRLLRFPWNNTLVAACAASPALCGISHDGAWRVFPLWTAGVIFISICLSEVVKDLQDMEGDCGYKDTLPTRLGRVPATLCALTLLAPLALAVLWFPLEAGRYTALGLIPVLSCLIASLKRPGAVYATERWVGVFLALFLITLLGAL